MLGLYSLRLGICDGDPFIKKQGADQMEIYLGHLAAHYEEEHCLDKLREFYDALFGYIADYVWSEYVEKE